MLSTVHFGRSQISIHHFCIRQQNKRNEHHVNRDVVAPSRLRGSYVYADTNSGPIEFDYPFMNIVCIAVIFIFRLTITIISIQSLLHSQYARLIIEEEDTNGCKTHVEL